MARVTILLLTMMLLAGCSMFKPAAEPEKIEFPFIEREFRAAWVATVANIDWPGAPGLSVQQQKREALDILDKAAELNLNALIFQVRPQCDALYSSTLEPWSYYLTGSQGQAPQPFYDPLQFWVEEAHKRGLELHAWFNPFRAHHPAGGRPGPESIVRMHPQWVRRLPNGYYWLDPGLQDVQNHTVEVVMDVLRRYDIDGIHFDDYFYPYGEDAFPDDSSWALYQAGGGKLARDDWRRDNVNRFIERLYKAIKREKRFVKFGISPFGIWRPGHPRSIQGFDQYARLFADARLWFNNGWIDYCSPQLYWPISQIAQSFPVLLGWWKSENRRDRHLWPGMFTSRFNDRNEPQEVINQIMISRGFNYDHPGHIHFSMKALMSDSSGIDSLLTSGPYKKPALIPPSPWLDKHVPSRPQLNLAVEGDSLELNWQAGDDEQVARWLLALRYGRNWDYRILPGRLKDIVLTVTIEESPADSSASPRGAEKLRQIGLSAVDRAGNVSTPQMLTLKNQF